MRKKLSLAFAMMLVLALATLSCSAPIRNAPTQHTTAENETVRDDMAAKGIRVSCIDVGKGDCILVQAGASAVLIDTGYRDTSRAVCSCLQEQGIVRLDAIILTHYDRDHVEGLRPVAEAVPTDVVYLPGYEGSDKNYSTTMAAIDDLGLATQRVTDEMTLELGEARMVVYPSGVDYVPGSGGDEGNDNDASLVIALTCDDDSYLFAGDLEEEGIDAFLGAGRGHFDVLKMPHHGEKSANSDELIDAVGPQVVLITDSDDEPADKKVLKLLKKAGVDVRRTSTDGTIVVESDGTGSYEVSSRP